MNFFSYFKASKTNAGFDGIILVCNIKVIQYISD